MRSSGRIGGNIGPAWSEFLTSARATLARVRATTAPWLSFLDRNRVAALIVTAVLIILIANQVAPGWSMRVRAVVIPAVWTIVVMRLLAVRATLPNRVFTTSLALGVLLAVFVAPIANRLPNPYGATSATYDALVSGVRLITLLSPAVALLFFNRIYRVTSVADAFFLTFMIGLGFDLAALVLATDRTDRLFQMTWLPPFQVVLDGRVAAGHAYWAGLVMLALGAALRFRASLAKLLRIADPRWSVAVPVVLTALAFLWATMEPAALYTGQQAGWITGVLRLGLNGRMTALAVVAALVALSWAEFKWTRRLTGVRSFWRDEWQPVIAGLRERNLQQARSAFAAFRRREQIEIGRSELAQSPGDRTLQQLLRGVEATRDVAPADETRPSTEQRTGWRDPRVGHAVGWIAVFLLLLLPSKVAVLQKFWTLPLIHDTIGTAHLTLFMLVLAAILIARFVRSAPKALGPPNPGERVLFQAEKMTLVLGIGVIAFTAFYVPPAGGVLILHNPVAAVTGPLEQPDRTGLLLLAVAVTGLTLWRTAAWERVSLKERRRAAVRHALTVVSAIVLVWLPVALHQRMVVALHARFGPRLKPYFLARYGAGTDTLSGIATSNTLALAAALAVALIVMAAALALHVQSRRIERFLAGDEPAPGGGG